MTANPTELLKELRPEHRTALELLKGLVNVDRNGTHDAEQPITQERVIRALNMGVARGTWGFFREWINARDSFAKAPTPEGDKLIDQFRGTTKAALEFQETLLTGKPPREKRGRKVEEILTIQLHPLLESTIYSNPATPEYVSMLGSLVTDFLTYTEFIGENEPLTKINKRTIMLEPKDPADKRVTFIKHPKFGSVHALISEGLHPMTDGLGRVIDRITIINRP